MRNLSLPPPDLSLDSCSAYTFDLSAFSVVYISAFVSSDDTFCALVEDNILPRTSEAMLAGCVS